MPGDAAPARNSAYTLGRAVSLSVLVLLAPALTTATIWLSGVLVDQVLAPHRLDLLPWYCLGYVALMTLSALFSFLRSGSSLV